MPDPAPRRHFLRRITRGLVVLLLLLLLLSLLVILFRPALLPGPRPPLPAATPVATPPTFPYPPPPVLRPHRLPSRRTVAGVLRVLQDDVRTELEPLCVRAGLSWPPRRVRLLAFKEERQLEVWGAGRSGEFRHLITYPILAASGGPGPKRRRGDRQVPEGFYRLESLNPQSRFHLSIRVNYPNEEDRAREGVSRDELGDDIYIHGNELSDGCLAMGDAAIERLFTLVALADSRRCDILIAPVDFRHRRDFPAPSEDEAVAELYSRLAEALERHPLPYGD